MLIILFKIFISLILLIFLIVYLLLYIAFKLTARRCTSKVCLIGKTVLITGGNQGIGFATCLDLAQRGCRLIIACPVDAEEARQKLIEETNNPNIVVKYLDLLSLESVRNFAKEINETEERLDILINNAGIGFSLYKHTQDNLNPLMQVNYFGPFLLTHLLIGLLKKTPNSRIVFVSSFVSYFHNLTTNNLNFPENEPVTKVNSIRLYANSKLCEVIAAKIFAEKLKPFGINSNSVHPGLVNTTIFQTLTPFVRKITFDLLSFGLKFVMKTPEEGAQPTLTAAISNEFENITGNFSWDFQNSPSHEVLKDERFCRKIWELTEDYVKLAPHERL